MIHLILLALSLVQAKEFDFDVKVSFVQPNSTDDLETVCTIETNQLDATFDIIWLLNNKQDGILKGQSARDVIISVKRTPDNLGNFTCSVTGNLGDIQLKREKTVELEFETGLLLDVIGDVKLAGLQATISCTAKGFPLKFIKWFYEDRLLDWKDHGDAAMMFLRRKIAGLSCEEIRQLTAEELNNPVSMGDFKEAILRCKKSVKHTELERYRHWINEFGST